MRRSIALVVLSVALSGCGGQIRPAAESEVDLSAGSAAPTAAVSTSPSTPATAPPTSAGRPVSTPGSIAAAGKPSTASPAPTDRVSAPKVGVAYPYKLFTHCGIQSAEFGDRQWRAVAPQMWSGNVNYTDGTMTLVAQDRTRFAWPGGSADFVPAGDAPIPLCQ